MAGSTPEVKIKVTGKVDRGTASGTFKTYRKGKYPQAYAPSAWRTRGSTESDYYKQWVTKGRKGTKAWSASFPDAKPTDYEAMEKSVGREERTRRRLERERKAIAQADAKVSKKVQELAVRNKREEQKREEQYYKDMIAESDKEEKMTKEVDRRKLATANREIKDNKARDKSLDKIRKWEEKNLKKEGGLFTKLARMLNQNTIDALLTAGVPFPLIRIARGGVRTMAGIEQGKSLPEVFGMGSGGGGSTSAGTGVSAPQAAQSGSQIAKTGSTASKGASAMGSVAVVAGILAAVLAVMYAIHKILLKFSQLYQARWESIMGTISGTLDTIFILCMVLVEWFLSGPGVELVKGVVDFAKDFKDAVIAIPGWISGLATSIGTWISELPGKIGAFFTEGVDGTIRFFEGKFESIIGWFEAKWLLFKGDLDWIKAWFKDKLEPLFSTISTVEATIQSILSPDYWAATPFAELFSGEFDLSKYNITNKFNPDAIFNKLEKWDLSLKDIFNVKNPFSLEKLFDLSSKVDLNLKDLFNLKDKFKIGELITDFTKDISSAVSGALDNYAWGGLF